MVSSGGPKNDLDMEKSGFNLEAYCSISPNKRILGLDIILETDQIMRTAVRRKINVRKEKNCTRRKE